MAVFVVHTNAIGDAAMILFVPALRLLFIFLFIVCLVNQAIKGQTTSLSTLCDGIKRLRAKNIFIVYIMMLLLVINKNAFDIIQTTATTIISGQALRFFILHFILLLIS